MFFKKRNESNQKALDCARDEILEKGINKLFELPDYGSGETAYNNKKYSYAFWKYRIGEDKYHFVMQIDQKAFLFFGYKFLSGLKTEGNSTLHKMNNIELSQYD